MAREERWRANNQPTRNLPVGSEEPRAPSTETRGSLRTEKIARIREQILQGTYQIAAAAVAKAILRNDPSRVLSKKKEG